MTTRQIYLDNAATTPVLPEVVEEMVPYFVNVFGNPSSRYKLGQDAKAAVDDARARIASHLGAQPQDIYFTACGTESNNWALKATAEAYKSKGRHIITTTIEHHAVSHTTEWLEKQGFEITYLAVDSNGLIKPSALSEAVRSDTILVSVIHGNNEIGTIQPIKELAAIAHSVGALFHTDAVQTVAHVPIDVADLGVDLLSASAHKFHGPKGIGFLYIRKGIKIRSFMHGGGQERKRRAGTENVPYIVGMAKALDICMEDFAARIERQLQLRDHLINRIMSEVEHVHLNGHRSLRLPNNTNFSFAFIEGESLLLLLEQRGIMASSGSACTSGSLDPSHVLLAIGLPHELAHGSLRLTLADGTTLEEIDYTVDAVKEVVAQLRKMSPLYEDFLKGKKCVSYQYCLMDCIEKERRLSQLNNKSGD